MSDTTVRPITPAVGFAREAHRMAKARGLLCPDECPVCQQQRAADVARCGSTMPPSWKWTWNGGMWGYHA